MIRYDHEPLQHPPTPPTHRNILLGHYERIFLTALGEDLVTLRRSDLVRLLDQADAAEGVWP